MSRDAVWEGVGLEGDVGRLGNGWWAVGLPPPPPSAKPLGK